MLSNDETGAGFPVPKVEDMKTESNLLSNLLGDRLPLMTGGVEVMGGGDQTGGEVIGGVAVF